MAALGGGVENDEHLAFGTIDSWLVWKLTGGVHITDTTNASRTLLFDIRNMRWSDEMCALFNVPMSALPEVRPSSGRFGVTTADLPIPSGVPVSGIAGDQQAALFGQACFAPGQAKNTYGTGSFVLMNVGETCPAPVEGLLTTVAWTLDSGGDWKTTFAYEGAIFVTGAAIQWLRDGLQIIDDAAETGPLAESIDDTGGVVFVPALAGLGSPYWDARARGTIVGITRGTGRAELVRATVEAMAYQTRDVVDAMAKASGTGVRDLRATVERRSWISCCSSRPTSSAYLSSDRRLPRRRRSVRPTWPALPRGCGTPRRCHRKLGGRWRVHPDHRPGARCRLRPLAASGRAQPRLGARGLGVEAGQRPAQIAHRLTDALLVLDQREADVALATGTETDARGERHVGFLHQHRSELDRAHVAVFGRDRRPREHRAFGGSTSQPIRAKPSQRALRRDS